MLTKCPVGVGPPSVRMSLFDWRFEHKMKILLLSLTGLTASGRPVLVSAASAVWLRTWAVKSGEVR